MNKISFCADVPVEFEVDICVAGAGPAGIAAALTASRNGAKVFLGEKNGCFGGMGTAGLVPAFCGMGDGINFLAGAICFEVFEKLKVESKIFEDKRPVIEPEALKRVYDQMIIDSSIEYALEVKLVATTKQGENITSAIFSGGDGLFAVKASVFIDCTGNGDLAAMAGAPYRKGNEQGTIMPSSLCSMWSGINWDEFYDAKPDILQLLLKAIDEEFFAIPDRHHTGMRRTGKSFASANMGHIFNMDATDFRALTKGWIEGRRLLPELTNFYRSYVPGFADAELVASAQSMGIRESRRIMADYILNLEDFKNRASFPDEIGRFAYSVDIHPLDPSVEEFERFRKDFLSDLRYKTGESYGVPYRILTPQKLSNTLVAGRCVSADQSMIASIRVMPGCFLTGQAAGYAAVLALQNDNNVREIPIEQIKEYMAKNNM